MGLVCVKTAVTGRLSQLLATSMVVAVYVPAVVGVKQGVLACKTWLLSYYLISYWALGKVTHNSVGLLPLQ